MSVSFISTTIEIAHAALNEKTLAASACGRSNGSAGAVDPAQGLILAQDDKPSATPPISAYKKALLESVGK